MSELRNFHMLLLAAEYVEGDAAFRAETWVEMDAADGHRRVRPRLSSTLQQTQSPSAPAHRPVLRSSSTLQQNRIPASQLPEDYIVRIMSILSLKDLSICVCFNKRICAANGKYDNTPPQTPTVEGFEPGVAITPSSGIRRPGSPCRQHL
ncbi:unnamed protein product [Sphagnum compactum]